MAEWQPIETVPKDRYVLLFSRDAVRWDGNMEVGCWFGEGEFGGFWSCGGPNGGLELNGCEQGGPGHYGPFTHWMDLPPDPAG
jgi:hypothetical protein